jgi:hypothetical protein
MSKISDKDSYPQDTMPDRTDYLIGTDSSTLGTNTYTLDSVGGATGGFAPFDNTTQLQEYDGFSDSARILQTLYIYDQNATSGDVPADGKGGGFWLAQSSDAVSFFPISTQSEYDEAYANGTRVFLLTATSPTSFNLTGSEIQTFYQYNNVRHTLTTSTSNAQIVLFCENISVVINGFTTTLRGKVGELWIPSGLGNNPRIEGMQVGYLNSAKDGLEVVRCDLAYCYQDTTATSWYFLESNIGVYNLRGASRNDSTSYQRVNVGVVENMNTANWGTSLIGKGWSTITSIFNLSVASGSMVQVRDTTTLTP